MRKGQSQQKPRQHQCLEDQLKLLDQQKKELSSMLYYHALQLHELQQQQEQQRLLERQQKNQYQHDYLQYHQYQPAFHNEYDLGLLQQYTVVQDQTNKLVQENHKRQLQEQKEAYQEKLEIQKMEDLTYQNVNAKLAARQRSEQLSVVKKHCQLSVGLFTQQNTAAPLVPNNNSASYNIIK